MVRYIVPEGKGLISERGLVEEVGHELGRNLELVMDPVGSPIGANNSHSEYSDGDVSINVFKRKTVVGAGLDYEIQSVDISPDEPGRSVEGLMLAFGFVKCD